MKKVTIIGGGTGIFANLSGLKEYPLDLGVVMTMMDSGGSTGKLRVQLGVLPPGDLRQCLVALSDAPKLWRDLFLYRFDEGDFRGHNFGNIFLSTLEKLASDYDEVVELASYILKSKGEVCPVTYTQTNLKATYLDGTKLISEDAIDSYKGDSNIVDLTLTNPAVATEKTVSRLKHSDFIILGPGDLYTSIFPVLLVDGVIDAIRLSKAKIIVVMNLMNKTGQTTDFSTFTILEEFHKYLGGNKIDYVLMSNSNIDKKVLAYYASHGELPIKNDLDEKNFKGEIIKADISSTISYIKPSGDNLERTLLRHDPSKVAGALYQIISQK